MNYNEEITRNFLNLYWIRPETVIWRILDVLQMKDIHFKKKPFLDLGCGDGTFSFTNFGGKCSIDFDIFQTKNTTNFFKGKDIYNQTSNLNPNVTKKPMIKIDVGVDWKQNLLDKAKKLHLYESLLKHDLNKPLPFEDDSFETIFSNTFYWIHNIQQLLSESNRILRKKGKLIICVPDIKFKKNLIYNFFLDTGQYWAKALDRGIYSNANEHCYSYSKWKSLIANSRFKIISHSSYLSENFIKFHNIGMRPYSPYVIEMANELSPNVRKRIKSRLIKEITPIISSYVNYELLSNKGCFHLFVLQK